MINLITLTPGTPIKPIPVVNLDRVAWVGEKPEGLTMIDEKTIVISSDNDFGMLLEGVIELGVEQSSVQTFGQVVVPTTERKQLPINNMSFFETVRGPDGRYSLSCKISGFGNQSLKLRPQDRADEKRPAFWVIHMKDPLLPPS